MKEFLERNDGHGSFLYITKTGEVINMETSHQTTGGSNTMENIGITNIVPKSNDIVATMSFPMEQMIEMFDKYSLTKEQVEEMIEDHDLTDCVETIISDYDYESIISNNINMDDIVDAINKKIDIENIAEQVFDTFDIDNYEDAIINMTSLNVDIPDEVNDTINSLIDQYSPSSTCGTAKSVANAIIDTVRYDLINNMPGSDNGSGDSEVDTMTRLLKKFILATIQESSSEVNSSDTKPERKYSLSEVRIAMNDMYFSHISIIETLDKLNQLK